MNDLRVLNSLLDLILWIHSCYLWYFKYQFCLEVNKNLKKINYFTTISIKNSSIIHVSKSLNRQYLNSNIQIKIYFKLNFLLLVSLTYNSNFKLNFHIVLVASLTYYSIFKLNFNLLVSLTFNSGFKLNIRLVLVVNLTYYSSFKENYIGLVSLAYNSSFKLNFLRLVSLTYNLCFNKHCFNSY